MKTSKPFDVFPVYTQYRPEQSVQVFVAIAPDCGDDDAVAVTVFHHHTRVHAVRLSLPELRRQQGIVDLGVFSEGGYHVACELQGEGGTETVRTAFDVRAHWRNAPRYSFLCNFAPTDPQEDTQEDMQAFFRHFHLNVTQFYDWMERHDALVPRTSEFVDPMGRKLYTEVITSRMQALRQIQSASIGYAAVYASLTEYAQAHPEQGIYDNQGVQYSLIDRFFLMDISEGSLWREHILAEFERVVQFGFDGLHLDQYGFPKSAQRRNGTTMWMDDAYLSFIGACREALGDQTGLIFNAVSSYPIHAVSASAQDAVYVEVWPPMVRYRHLCALIERVRREAAGTKQVILAAYLKSFRAERETRADAIARSVLLVTAVIFASGGYHLLLGEVGGMLAEAYYPDYNPMIPELYDPLRAMYDIVTADADLLSAPDVVDVSWSFVGGINEEILIRGAPISVEPDTGTVWVRVTLTERGLVLHFINLLWVDHEEWNSVHQEPFRSPPPLDVSIEWNHPVDGVFVQRAEATGWIRADADWKSHVRGKALHLTVPSFDVWAMVFVPYNTDSESAK